MWCCWISPGHNPASTQRHDRRAPNIGLRVSCDRRFRGGEADVGMVFRMRGDTGRIGRCATLGVARLLGLSGSRDGPAQNLPTARQRPGWES